MRKHLLIVMMVLVTGAIYAQETLTGWTFPANSGTDSLNANLGITQNKAYDIRFQWVLTPTSDSTLNTVTFTDGTTSYAAATTGWENGTNVKFWSVKFKASDYTNFKVSSKQKSDAVSPGPRDFKVQWRLSSGTYADVAGGTVTLGADWTTGVVNNLPVPITGQGTGSVYIRWIMASNISIQGYTVASTGQSMIDDILITGTSTLGQNEILYTNRLRVFPSPNNGTFTLLSTEQIDALSVTDMRGRNIQTIVRPAQKQSVAISDANPGLYLLKVKFSGSDEEFTTRVVVE